MTRISPNSPCPCNSGAKYKKCCRILHNGNPAPTPESLMRSRYSAYALDNAAYIMATTHPDNTLYRDDKTAWRTDIETFMRSTRFAGLQILNFEDDTVTFRATLFEGERDISFTEKSLFRQHDGRWLYLSGERE